MSKNLFKITNEDCKYGKETVGDTNFKEHYPGVHMNMSWNRLEPFIRQATEKYVYPYICEEAFCELADKYQEATVLKFKSDIIGFINGAAISFEEGAALTIEEAKLVLMLQDVIAYYTMHIAMAVLNTVIAGMGVQESSSSDSTSMPVSMWRYKNTRWEICMIADSGMDRILTFIYKHFQKSNTTLSEKWKDCPFYTKSQTCFFRSLDEFQECEDLNNSWRAFKALVPYINKAAHFFIKPVLCDAYYAELCKQIKEGKVTEQNEPIVQLVRQALSNYTLRIGIPHLSVVIENDGIKMVSSTDGMNVKATANDTAIQRLIDQAEADANIFKGDLMAKLNENPDLYPIWKASDCYEDPEEDCGCSNSNEIGGVFL